MQSLAKMMRTDKATEENQKMYSMHFSNKIGTMSGLLENILQWIRSQREGLKFKIQTIDLREVIIENINVASSQAELKGIKIMNEIHSEVQIMGDKNVVHLVVRNLLSNAIKFTENGGEVHVSSKVLNGEVEVEVRDTGVGMSAEKLAMLFHDETHFTTPDTTKKDGTGLGLLLCKEFLSKTSGEIWAESKEGEGSSFKFRLPKG
jgi:signal transduction histidine kinase